MFNYLYSSFTTLMVTLQSKQNLNVLENPKTVQNLEAKDNIISK